MGSDLAQIFPTGSYYRDHSILYALVCEKELSLMGKSSGNLNLVCENNIGRITARKQIARYHATFCVYVNDMPMKVNSY